GSIITPSAYCGLSGLRPTYGAISRHGAMALCWTLDKLGPMCRSALDCGLVLSVVAGRDPLDPTSRASDQLPRYSPAGQLLNPRRHAKRMRAPMRRAWAEMFRKYDMLAAPSRSTVSYPVDKTFDKAYPGIGASSPIGAANLVGVPAISVPNGFGQNGLPTGIQLVGPAWSERDLIELAVAYQSQTEWHKKRPPEI